MFVFWKIQSLESTYLKDSEQMLQDFVDERVKIVVLGQMLLAVQHQSEPLRETLVLRISFYILSKTLTF